MLLKKILIENYRSCLRTTMDLQPHLSVLIGPNGSGKTNFLQGCMLLNKIVNVDPFRHSRHDSLAANARIKSDFQIGQTELKLDASLTVNTSEENRDNIVASVEKWTVKRRRSRAKISFDFPLGILSSFPIEHLSRPYHAYLFRLRRGRRSQRQIPPQITPLMQRIATYCTHIKYYGASQFTNPTACPASFEIQEEGRRLRSFHQKPHTRILYDMYISKNEDQPGYSAFMDIVGPKGLKLIDALDFKTVPTSSVDYAVRVGGKLEERKRNKLLVIPQFRIGKQKLSPNQLSEGTFKTLALLFHVVTEKGSIVLIEEPEVCVHHGLLASILSIIKSSSLRKQIILSTHSDYVLDHVKPDNVYRVSFDRLVGTTISHIPNVMSSVELRALRDYLEREGNLGDYWREGGLGDSD